MQVTTTPENFKKTFKPYLVKWSIAYGILMSFVTVLPFFRDYMDYMNELAYGTVTFGLNFVGLIAIGVNVAGLIAVGCNAAGVIAIGYNAVGLIAIGCNAVGILSIAANAWGVATIGWHTFGILALGYDERSKGKYLFAPHRQDAEAVSFFTRWFPKLRAVAA